MALLVLGTMWVQPRAAQAQGSSAYLQMNRAQRELFVREQALRIARDISGRDYQLTPDFLMAIQKHVDSYANRVGNNVPERIGRSDIRLVCDRGRTYAPLLSTTFASRNLSPLIGLYLPMIESEFINLQSANVAGALGMFQFLPATGKRYGLSKEELLDVEKSADAAARYISDGITQFNDDPMKEALALLAYNRGGKKVAQDLEAIVTKENSSCSICALTAASAVLDKTFQDENVYYVPRFFAAAIIGENPSSFGLVIQPLSTYR
jgi:hypothetical protein